ncbi:hypothetical protein V6Z11_D11G059200 [Gossypium hirsutum]
MEQWTTVAESKSSSPAEEPNRKESDPEMDADEFVIVPTTEPEKEEEKEAQNPKENEIQSERSPNQTSTGSRKSVRWSAELVSESPAADHSVTMSAVNGSNPYIAQSPAPESFSTSFKEKMDTVKDVLGRWGRKVGEATRKAEDLAGNTWQHLKTSPSLAEAAMGRIAQGTKVLAEAGPVMGILYVSTAKLAYCSDTPLPYKNGTQTEWSYYKVVIPLHQLKAVNPSTSRLNCAEKYIQVITVDSHEFWFMGFLNYDGAVTCLKEALQLHS